MALLGISFSVAGVISFLHFPALGLLFLLIESILIGVLSIVTAVGYWHLKPWGVYVHLLSLAHIIPFIMVYPERVAVYWIGLILSFSIVVLMATYLKIKVFIVTTVIGLALTCASFAYQQMGPEIGVYGTECKDQPRGFCYGPLLGAGLPMQYVLDQPGVSVMYKWGMEDNFRIAPFLLDVLFYSAIIYGSIKFIRRYCLRKQNQVQRDGSPAPRAPDLWDS
jgi:hypothetical protein